MLGSWPTADIAGQAWRDHGWIAVAADDDEAIMLADQAANEHLEVHVEPAKLDSYLERLRNYGSLFLGDQATVAYGERRWAPTTFCRPAASLRPRLPYRGPSTSRGAP